MRNKLQRSWETLLYKVQSGAQKTEASVQPGKAGSRYRNGGDQ